MNTYARNLHRTRTTSLAAAALLLFMLAGCVSTDYIGAKYPATENVDLYFSEDDIERPYKIFGEVRAEMPKLGEAKRLQKALIKQAKKKGADGLVIGPIDVRSTGQTSYTNGRVKVDKGKISGTTTTIVQEVKEVRALLIKYTS